MPFCLIYIQMLTYYIIKSSKVNREPFFFYNIFKIYFFVFLLVNKIYKNKGLIKEIEPNQPLFNVSEYYCHPRANTGFQQGGGSWNHPKIVDPPNPLSLLKCVLGGRGVEKYLVHKNEMGGWLGNIIPNELFLLSFNLNLVLFECSNGLG